MPGRRKEVAVEDQEFRDTGCVVAPRCLECPLPVCRFELSPGENWKLMRELRAASHGDVITLLTVVGGRG